MTATTHARAWIVTRPDGLTLGFTDHDEPLTVAGVECRPDSGLSASAFVAGTGFAVDNAEATGAMSSDAITEADIESGLWDGATVAGHEVDWANGAARLTFRGSLGEIRRGAGAFHAELRGLTEALNRPIGRLYQRDCDATLGDARCRAVVPEVEADAPAPGPDAAVLDLTLPDPPRRFERGTVRALTGGSAGQVARIRTDRPYGAGRRLELWTPLPMEQGDRIALTPGCDKRAETCRVTFDNLLNFRGFPHIPGEDWLIAVPARRAR